MGAICSKQHIKQQPLQVAISNDFQIILNQEQHQEQGIEEVEDKKLTKIDQAQNSIDLTKKRYSSKDMSISKYVENEIKNQSYRLEKLTIDMRDPSISGKGATLIIRKDTSFENSDEEDVSTCNTIYANVNHKKLKNINEQCMSLLYINENKQFNELLHRVVNDYHFIIKNQEEFGEILMRSQESFLQNLQISPKQVNEYGILHIMRESLKSKLELLLQNDYTINRQSLNYNKLQVDIKYLPQILSTQNVPLFILQFKQTIFQYKQLANSNQILINFINSIREQLNIQLQFLSLSEQNQILVLTFIICEDINDTQTMINFISNQLKFKLGFLNCKTQQLVKYVGCELSYIDPWNNIEYIQGRKPKHQQYFGWKLFGFKIQQPNMQYTCFIECIPNQNYNDKIQIYQLEDLNKYKLTFENIEVKVYGEKKYYKILFQITYNVDNIIKIDNYSYLTTLLHSNIIGFITYDVDKIII